MTTNVIESFLTKQKKDKNIIQVDGSKSDQKEDRGYLSQRASTEHPGMQHIVG